MNKNASMYLIDTFMLQVFYPECSIYFTLNDPFTNITALFPVCMKSLLRKTVWTPWLWIRPGCWSLANRFQLHSRVNILHQVNFEVNSGYSAIRLLKFNSWVFNTPSQKAVQGCLLFNIYLIHDIYI